MSIRLRLTAWYALVLAAALLAVAAALLLGFRGAMERQFDADLAARAELLATAVGEDDDELRLRQSGEPELVLGGEVALLFDPLGALVEASTDHPALASAAAPLATLRAPPDATVVIDGERVRLRSFQLFDGSRRRGTLVLGRSLAPVDRAEGQLVAALLVLVPLAVALAAGAGYFLADRALRPVERLRRSAEDYGAHDLTRRLGSDAHARDELGRLARTLDGMLERIALSVEQQRRFTADASHELRTPIATILAETSLSLERARDAAGYRRVVERVQGEAQRMARIVEGLLFIARSDAGSLVRGAEVVQLVPLLERVAERFGPTAAERSVAIRVQVDAPVSVHGDGVALERVFDNLIENALRHSPAGEAVDIALARADGHAIVSVRDRGPGIPLADRELVFERFRRGRSESGGGSGLGLSIARSVVEAHGGRIRVDGAEGRGAVLVVDLPAS